MHPFFRFIPLLGATTVLAAQTSERASDRPISLDALVVSAGFDDKTAFDLAQGTAILAGDDLRRKTAGTLGETLDATPGVNATAYGPGASRPIIRGLGGDRIRILQSGVGSLDAANISPDHSTALEPLFANRIEALRGPATLLYGSSAVGGVVNVIDNRIPERRVERPAGGIVEFRGWGASDETTGVAALTAGARDVAVHVNALSHHAGDLRIPRFARIDENAPADQPAHTLPNSDVTTRSGSIGSTWFGNAGHFGAAISSYETNYGVPVDEPISISLRQTRLDFHGEITQPLGILSGVKVQFGLGDYHHSEIADHTTVNTRFLNKAWEGRVELPHQFSETLNGTWGAQASRSDFSAVGDEVVTPPSLTQNRALFALEEWKLPAVTLQFGGRIELQSITLGRVDPGLPDVAGYRAVSGEKKNQNGTSGSAGLVFHPAKDWAVGLSLAYSERMPTAQELYSNGPHGGTGAWEVGRADLKNEQSLGLDLSVRKRSGVVTGAFGGFVNRFRGYIFEQALPAAAIPSPSNPESLTPYQFEAKDAAFYGAEMDVVLHLIEREKYAVHLQLTADYVHAQQTTDHEPLPRIPPLRASAALRFDGARWHLGTEVRQVERQNRVTKPETTTPGYTFLNMDLTYVLPAHGASYEFFARGTNLTNQEARVHASFLKDFAPLAGRAVLLDARMIF